MFRRMTVAASLGALLLPTLTQGAPRHVKTYAGPRLSRAEVALLERSERAVMIHSVDLKQIPVPIEDTAASFELLAGPHDLRVRYARASSSGDVAVSQRDQVVRFEAEAGHSYSLVGRVEGGRWEPRVVDMTTTSDEREKRRVNDLERAFTEFRRRPPATLSVADAVALVNVHYLKVLSVDGDERAREVTTHLFKLAPGRHTLRVVSIVRKETPPETVEVTALSGHVYALIEGGGLPWDPWRPDIVDITGEMDNVKESYVESINNFLTK